MSKRTGGFECEFVEPPPKFFKVECCICHLILREPYQAVCCGKRFCDDCLEDIRDTDAPCPHCRDPDFCDYTDKGHQQTLYEFKVYCTHKSQGCEWTGELRELDNHLNSDPQADESLQGCPYETIACPMKYVGCEVELPRNEMKEHLSQEAGAHVMMHSTMFLKLREENKELKTTLDKIQTELKEVRAKQRLLSLPSLEFVMTDYHLRCVTIEDWCSPSFYSHPNGYKMCLKVSPLGNHLSVSVYLMQGKYDSNLKWPFRGDITLQLVNQESGENSITKVISFNDNTSDEAASRVLFLTKIATRGCKIHKFIASGDLKPKFLKNDCLRFRIPNISLK